MDTDKVIKPGDWVKLGNNSVHYQDFHVTHVDVEKGLMWGGFGSKDESQTFWLFGQYDPKPIAAATELWRKFRATKSGTFDFNGKTCQWHEYGFEWRRIW